MGVSSIERTTKRLLPLLFVLVIVVCVRTLTLMGPVRASRSCSSPTQQAVGRGGAGGDGAGVLQAVGGDGHDDHLWQLL